MAGLQLGQRSSLIFIMLEFMPSDIPYDQHGLAMLCWTRFIMCSQ